MQQRADLRSDAAFPCGARSVRVCAVSAKLEERQLLNFKIKPFHILLFSRERKAYVSGIW